MLAGAVPAFKSFAILSWIGLPGAAEWGWEFAPAMGYIGQGMIMGPRTAASMLVGALLGYAVLGPMAHSKGWAPGPVSDWQHGAAGWVMWVSLSIMLSDSLSSLALLLAKTAVQRHKQAKRERAASRSLDIVDGADGQALPREMDDGRGVPRKLWLSGLMGSWVLCVAVMSPMFGLPLYQPALAVGVALLVAVVAVRALGETDLNPVSGVGKVSQLVFALVAPGQVVPNLVAGAIAEAGAQQAGDLMQDFKTAHLLGVDPRAQFWAMLLGSAASIPISVGAYALYSSAYEIPGPEFAAPAAQIWLDMARLVNGGSLPTGVGPYCLGFAVLAAALPALGMALNAALPRAAALGSSRGEAAIRLAIWAFRHFVPSGVAVAVGMYISPKWTIPRVLGSLIEQGWRRLDPGSHRNLMLVTASGLVLGEGTASIFLAVSRALFGK